MTLEVLGIEFDNIVDLIRFNINVKQERLGLISYKERNVFYIGFYYPSFLKKPFVSFLYVVSKSPPPEVYFYNPEPVNEDYLLKKPDFSHIIVRVPVASIEERPHIFTNPRKIKNKFQYIRVRDLKSLLYIALSTYFESSDLPYIWYDITKEVYVLGVHSSGNSEDMNLYFYLNGRYMGPYISISNDYKALESVKSVKDVSKSYFLISRIKKLPYLYLKSG